MDCVTRRRRVREVGRDGGVKLMFSDDEDNVEDTDDAGEKDGNDGEAVAEVLLVSERTVDVSSG